MRKHTNQIFASVLLWPEAAAFLVDDFVTMRRNLMSPDGGQVVEYIVCQLLEELQQSQREGKTEYLPDALMKPFGYYAKISRGEQNQRGNLLS
jgi:hypothetical protein